MRYVWIVFYIAAALSASAAEVGRAELKGRTIVLDSDRSWQFLDEMTAAASQNCTPLSSAIFPVKFCLDDASWRRDPDSGSFEMLFNTKSGDLYFGIISEEIYIDRDTFKTIIIKNAESAAGLKGVLSQNHSEVTLGDYQWDLSVYEVEYGSTPFTFENYHTSIEGVGSVQVIFWTGTSVYDKYDDLRKQVLAKVAVVN
jgi:hypothetical protein